MSGLTTVKASGAAIGFSQGGHASLFAAEYQQTYAPEWTQFCAVGFDPVVTSDYVTSIYNAASSPQYLSAIIYGQWIENSSLVLTNVLSSTAAGLLPNLNTWSFTTSAANINFSLSSYVANPATMGVGWAAAVAHNTPGHQLARPSRVYSPTSGIGGGDVWLGYAVASGTNASRVTGPGGHSVILYTDAISWVATTLAAQTTGGGGGSGGNTTTSSDKSFTTT
jgi:hypothetical protein